MKKMHASNTGNHQGLIIDEDGQNVAVTYEAKDAESIVKMQEMNEELLRAVKILMDALSRNGGTDSVAVVVAKMNVRYAIEKAEEE